jgi:hypothetical protein
VDKLGRFGSIIPIEKNLLYGNRWPSLLLAP